MNAMEPSRAGLQASPMGLLPSELTHSLFQNYLSPWDIIRVGMTCYDLSELSKNEGLWKSKVKHALKQRNVDHIIALALIYLVAKCPQDQRLGYELAARADRMIKRPAQTALEEFVLAHSRMASYPRPDPTFVNQIASAQTRLLFFQGLVDKENPFTLYSQGLCGFYAKNIDAAQNMATAAQKGVIAARIALALFTKSLEHIEGIVSMANEGEAIAGYFLYLLAKEKPSTQESEDPEKTIKAEQFLSKAAESGSYLAQYELSCRLFFEEKYEEAVRWGVLSAKQKYRDAHILLGYYCSKILKLVKEEKLTLPENYLTFLQTHYEAKKKKVYFYLGRFLGEKQYSGSDSFSLEARVDFSRFSFFKGSKTWSDQQIFHILAYLHNVGKVFAKDEKKEAYYLYLRNCYSTEEQRANEQWRLNGLTFIPSGEPLTS